MSANRPAFRAGFIRARLAAIREQAYCIGNQELESGLRSLALPVRNQDGQILGAINVRINAARVARARLEDEFLPLLLKTSRQIERTVD